MGGCGCADEAGGEEGVDGDKNDGLLEDGVWKGADGELGTDKGRQVAEGEFGSGVRGVDEVGSVEKVRVGMAWCGETDLRTSEEVKGRSGDKRRTLMEGERDNVDNRSIIVCLDYVRGLKKRDASC